MDKDVDHGRNAIVKLTIHIFSVIANSARCECVFSNFGVTHTKHRNKLDPKKVHNMAVVGMQIKREDSELGLACNRKKRKFEEITKVDQPLTLTSTDTSEHINPTDFQQYAEGLFQQVELSNQEDDDDVFPPSIMPTLSEPTVTPANGVQQAPCHSLTLRSHKTQIPGLTRDDTHTEKRRDTQERRATHWPKHDILMPRVCFGVSNLRPLACHMIILLPVEFTKSTIKLNPLTTLHWTSNSK